MDNGEKVGKITHFFPKISVAVVELSKDLRSGDRIRIEGRGQKFEQVVESMQIEHKNIPHAKPGDSVGMKVSQAVKPGDIVYKV